MTYKMPFLFIFLSVNALALEPISDDELNNYTGQNGVYLSGDISLNEVGGPLASGDSNNVDPNDGSTVWGTCAGEPALKKKPARSAAVVHDCRLILTLPMATSF